MSTTLDVNVLVYAPATSSDRHLAAAQTPQRFASGPAIGYLFWPVIIAYYGS